MAPRNYPDEIDVFTVPHSRMKELVNIYTEKVQCINFRDGREVVSLLRDLGTTLYEFKSHESIENIFIMDQLKNRLKQRQIHNSAVCDCHNDNRLADVLQLVRTGTKVREQGMTERLTFCQELQRVFEEFVANFLTHMEEEEQVFQPLLVEYFEYDELKILKDIVLKEHEHVKERHLEKAHEEEPETCDVVKDLRDLDWDLCCLSDESLEQEDNFPSLSHSPYEEALDLEVDEELHPSNLSINSDFLSWEQYEAPNLPFEVLMEIFQHLSPQDLGRCAQVCSTWNNAAYTPSLWKAIYPVQWARGIWDWHDVGLVNRFEDEAQKVKYGFCKIDEDKDIDEAAEEQNPLAFKEWFILEGLVNWVLPRIGHGVKALVVDAGSGITSRPLHHALILCPNINVFSAAYTRIDYYLFKGLWLTGALKQLERLDLRGCELIDDVALEFLARCGSPNHPYLVNNAHIPDDAEVDFEDPSCFNSINEDPFDESLQVHDDSIFQYCCEYCMYRQANVGSQRPSKPYSNNFCQNRYIQSIQRQREIAKSFTHIKSNFYLSTSDPVLNSHHRYDDQTNHPHSNNGLVQISKTRVSLNPERDIEEICCKSRSLNSSVKNIPPSHSSRRQTICSISVNHSNFERSSNLSKSLLQSVGCFQLTHLILSGCWRITDEGLLAMVDAGVVNNIYHLDVSGCFQLSGEGLTAFAAYSRDLGGKNLYYCDNIVDGPYPSQANGCNNLCNPVRVCCRNGK